MKIKYLLYAFLPMLLLATPSCSLEEDASRISTPGNFFRKVSECQAVVNGCYIPLKNIYTYTYMIATEGVTDIMYIASGTQDAQLDISPAKPRFGSTVWTQCYIGVQRCNFAIAGISGSEFIEDTDKTRLLGEAVVLRAYFYYILTSFFGDVPYYEDDVTDQETLLRIAKLPRMSAVESRNELIKQLQFYAPQLDQVRTSEIDGNRLGAAVAWMLIGKLAMWNQEWSTALSALQELEKIYGQLSQYDLETNIKFRNKNTLESIMEIQHTYTAGGLIYSSNVASICMPYPRKAHSNIYDGVEVPELGDASTAWSPLRPNTFFSQGLQPKLGADLRTELNMAWAYNGHTFANVNSRPWMGPKFWCPNLQSGYDGNNYKVFRFADAVLMMSECYCMMKQEDKSMEYLNMVKERANIKLYTKFKSYAHLMDEIRNERARELIGEFQRKYDLVRWGIWYQSVMDYTDYARVLENILPCHEYYPIPDTEVVYSGYNLDNKAYEAYGL